MTGPATAGAAPSAATAPTPRQAAAGDALAARLARAVLQRAFDADQDAGLGAHDQAIAGNVRTALPWGAQMLEAMWSPLVSGLVAGDDYLVRARHESRSALEEALDELKDAWETATVTSFPGDAGDFQSKAKAVKTAGEAARDWMNSLDNPDTEGRKVFQRALLELKTARDAEAAKKLKEENVAKSKAGSAAADAAAEAQQTLAVQEILSHATRRFDAYDKKDSTLNRGASYGTDAHGAPGNKKVPERLRSRLKAEAERRGVWTISGSMTTNMSLHRTPRHREQTFVYHLW